MSSIVGCGVLDVAVVGAGHAGIEAALAAARMGKRVALVTCDKTAVGRMSCNPAIGGLGKGHLVREIDALGGQMGLCADRTGIHFRRLNMKKGAAVRGTRAQSDKQAYSRDMCRTVTDTPGLSLHEGEVTDFIRRGMRIEGLRFKDGSSLDCRAVVLTTGTFLQGRIHVGDQQSSGGRVGERAANDLADALKHLGLVVGRLKTGTPCRLDRNSLDFDQMTEQPGDHPPPKFSHWGVWPAGIPPMKQISCHITYTNEATHDVIRDNLHRSAMYSGAIDSTGPRYCPSIEDKVVRFADRTRHQIFVEPEGLDTVEVYPNGISTSLPADVQEQFVRSIVGFERAKIIRPGYAVEYGYCDPTQLDLSLRVKSLEGLFFAGQINGTTGYEEAAAQGLMAGINAVRYVDEEEPVVLKRDQAYIGVMIDDLVGRGVGGEPYRMFTSRAEYRLLLREDNAAARLTPQARDLGLISESQFEKFLAAERQIDALEEQLATARLTPAHQSWSRLRDHGIELGRPGTTAAELLRRPEVSLRQLIDAELIVREGNPDDPTVLEQVEIRVKYQPYIARQADVADRLRRIETKPLPQTLHVERISGLSGEVREKLMRYRPQTLGQASRIPGVTPAAIALLDVHIRNDSGGRPR